MLRVRLMSDLGCLAHRSSCSLLHLAVVTRSCVAPVACERSLLDLLLEQQLIVLRRARQRAPNLALSDRLISGLGSLFLSPARIRKVAIGGRPSTLLAFHQALVRPESQRLFSSSPCPRKPDRRAERGTRPGYRRAQVTQSSVRLSADCAHHLAHVRYRHRQEHRLPRAVETLSPSSERHRALVVIVHRPHERQPVERAISFDASPSCSGATGCSWSWNSSRVGSSESACTSWSGEWRRQPPATPEADLKDCTKL